MKTKPLLCLFALLLLMLLPTTAQEHPPSHETDSENHGEATHEHDKHHRHRLVLFTGYGLIPGAIDEQGDKGPSIIPIISLDYEFWFNHTYGMALKNDLELATYAVEKDHQEFIDRNYAYLVSLVFLWEPIRNWALFAGPGYEFEEHHSFPVFKLGTDISKSFQDGWAVGLTIAYDFKEVNSSFSLGITVAKQLGN